MTEYSNLVYMFLLYDTVNVIILAALIMCCLFNINVKTVSLKHSVRAIRS